LFAGRTFRKRHWNGAPAAQWSPNSGTTSTPATSFTSRSRRILRWTSGALKSARN